MTDISMYEKKRTHDHIDRLYNIENLAKAGAASTDTCLSVEHLSAVYCCLFEIIHKLAAEALEIAEIEAKKAKRSGGLNPN